MKIVVMNDKVKSPFKIATSCIDNHRLQNLKLRGDLVLCYILNQYWNICYTTFFLRKVSSWYGCRLWSPH